MLEKFFFMYTTWTSFFSETIFFENWIFISDATTMFWKDSFSYYYVTNYSFTFTFKLAICLVFLSAIRGGVPRYRYDFLTKMGWIKFLGLVLSVFISTFLILIVW